MNTVSSRQLNFTINHHGSFSLSSCFDASECLVATPSRSDTSEGRVCLVTLIQATVRIVDGPSESHKLGAFVGLNSPIVRRWSAWNRISCPLRDNVLKEPEQGVLLGA